MPMALRERWTVRTYRTFDNLEELLAEGVTREAPDAILHSAAVSDYRAAGIFAGLRVALTISLILAVVTEMLSGSNGLGHNIILAARSFRSADQFAGIIVLGAIGYVTNGVLEQVERHILRWRL